MTHLLLSLLVILFSILASVHGQFPNFVRLSADETNQLSPRQRMMYLNAFIKSLREAHQQEQEEQADQPSAIQLLNDAANGQSKSNEDKCTPDQKFNRCCWQRNFDCSGWTDPDQLRADACKYPPNDLSLVQGMCLGTYINEYIMCYADGVDNTAACKKNGVDICTWSLFFTADCTDFCKGNHHMISADSKYNCCSQWVKGIAAANKAGNDMSVDTAAIRWNFCKRDCKPSFPEWCRNTEAAEQPLMLEEEEEEKEKENLVV